MDRCGLQIGDKIVQCNCSTDDDNPAPTGTIIGFNDTDGMVVVDWGVRSSEITIDDIMPTGGW